MNELVYRSVSPNTSPRSSPRPSPKPQTKREHNKSDSHINISKETLSSSVKFETPPAAISVSDSNRYLYTLKFLFYLV